MRRFAIALPVVAVLAGLYLIATRGAHHPTRPAAALPVIGTQQPALPAPTLPTTRTPPPRPAPARIRASRPKRPRRAKAGEPAANRPPARHGHVRAPRRRVLTASRTDCRWRRYRDGALGSDRRCAPGALDTAAVAHPARTVCSPKWLASARGSHVSEKTLERLVIEYQLPGPPSLYVVAHVVPVADGGSPTSPRNLYVLPMNGWGGERTQSFIARRLHGDICEHELTIARAASKLEGDWLADPVEAN